MSTLNILTAFYDWLRYCIPHVAAFPRTQRFLLGERLEQSSFDVLELLIEAHYSREKGDLLQCANVKLEQLRYYADYQCGAVSRPRGASCIV